MKDTIPLRFELKITPQMLGTGGEKKVLLKHWTLEMMKLWVPLPGKGTVAVRAALPVPISVCCIFMCPNNVMAASVWDF